MTETYAAAPRPAHRLIPSQFPPIGLFDTVATTADLAAVMELVGWTNDRLVAERVHRLPQSEWVFGIPNASIVMAAFLHVAPGGMRFNGPELGAWYAADALRTAAAEVGHHLRRETVARGVATMSRTFRAYSATLLGDYLDIRGQQGDAARHLCQCELRGLAAARRASTRVRRGRADLRQPPAPRRRLRCRSSAAPHHRHPPDRSFRNHGAGRVAHHRSAQIVVMTSAGSAAEWISAAEPDRFVTSGRAEYRVWCGIMIALVRAQRPNLLP